jgi:outer membrane protein assembly factor BamB
MTNTKGEGDRNAIPAIDTNKGLLFVSTYNHPAPVYGGHLYAIDIYTGEIVWQHSYKRGGAMKIVVADNKLFVHRGPYHDGLYVLSADNGTTIWAFGNKNATYFAGGMVDTLPAVGYSKVFGIDDSCSRVWAFDTNTGGGIWCYQHHNYYCRFTTPTVADGKIFVGSDENYTYRKPSNEGYIYALDAETGKLLWKFKADAGVLAQPVVAYGKLFFATANGTIYALGEKEIIIESITPPSIPIEVKISVVVIAAGVIITGITVQLYRKNMKGKGS